MRRKIVVPSKKPVVIKVGQKPKPGNFKLPYLDNVPVSGRVFGVHEPPPRRNRDPNEPLFDGPIKPSEVIQEFREYITDKEQAEILQYRDVYYIGKTVARAVNGTQGIPNFFRFVAGGHIAYRYEQEAVLGKGSFGSVLKCIDHKTGDKVAIKMMRDKPKDHEHIVMELNLLVQLQTGKGEGEETGVIGYVDNFTFRGFFCIVMELVHIDMYTALKAQRFVSFQAYVVKMVARDVANALAFIHARGIVHCDIKPENVMFTTAKRNAAKVIDFGCSCFVGKVLFSYIQSRYYRAPEVVLGSQYSTEIDVWSLACVLCEMVTGEPLFSARDEGDLIDMIVELCGLPPRSMLCRATRAHNYFNRDGTMKAKGRTPGSQSIERLTKIHDRGMLDLIEKCLKWEPSERLTARQILEHEWVADIPIQKEVPMSART